jgi:hypothetical protein
MSQFAWLGLLKWSLSYQDGTESMQPAELSEDKKEFLKSVMEDGIIDEGVRMRYVLISLTKYLHNELVGGDITDAVISKLVSDMKTEVPIPDTDKLLELLDELRDIIEQIDFSHSFAKMDGIPFLLGASNETKVNRDVRVQCIKMIATLAQNNPDVQVVVRECKAVESLMTILKTSTDNAMTSAILQALSSCVRGYVVAEEEYVAMEVDKPVIAPYIVDGTTDEKVLMRALFFLRALIGAEGDGDDKNDGAACKRVGVFGQCYEKIVELARTHSSVDVRETALSVVVAVMDAGEAAASAHVYPRAALIQEGARGALERLQGTQSEEERECVKVEVDLWMEIMKRIKSKLMSGGNK